MPTPEFYKQLIERYRNNEASQEELLVFYKLLKENKLDEYLGNAIQQEFEQKEPLALYDSKLRHISVWKKLVAAAIFVLLSIGVIYFISTKQQPVMEISRQSQEQRFKNDVEPGGNKATLQLGNGTIILLDSIQNGRLAEQGNTTILKVDDGQLAYNTTIGEAKQIAYNTVTTPYGGKYMVILPDNTKAYINARSSLRFPTAFTGNERLVEISGEVWFEVAKNERMPFKVQHNGLRVEALGTQFNVNTYADEQTLKITLAEGAIKVTYNNEDMLLSPGQQAQVKANGTIAMTRGIDMEEIAAWKNDIFYFNNTSIENIMRQVERWYNVKVNYAGKVGTGFNGDFSRNITLTSLLKVLELTGEVKFTIEGQQITVYPR